VKYKTLGQFTFDYAIINGI